MNIKKDGKFIGVDLYVGYMMTQGFPAWVHLPIWVGTFRPVTMGAQGGRSLLGKSFAPLQNVLDIVQNYWT